MDPNKTIPPIINGLEPSEEQKAPILSRGKDIVVTAGAGTGKTRTLVARYLGLLAEGIPLRSIAAITFTQKAAREMRNRVREEVRKYILEENLSESEKQMWRNVYEELDAARISTIHSLAGDILRHHPAELGLDPGFETLDEGEARSLKALSIEAALAWAGGDQLASGLFPVFGSWKLRRILGALLDKRLDVKKAFEEFPANLWLLWRPQLVEPLERFIQDPIVRQGLDELTGLLADGTLERAQDAGDLLANDLRIIIECWREIIAFEEQKDWTQISRAVGRLRKHLKQKGKTQNWEPANPKAIIKEIQKVFDDQIGRNEMDLTVDKILAEEVIPALRSLFFFAEGWYAEAREGINSLDFDDLESRILQLFKSNPKALLYWQKQIQAVLVDEYQDTNSRQRELVNFLNGEGNHLFIVGDGKQSIYRFRGADVAVFREEKKRVNAQGESYQLDRSYRSHQALLEDINILLSPVLGERDDLPFLEPFTDLSPGRKSSPRIDLPAYTEFHLAAGGKSAGGGGRAAEAVACRLLELVRSNEETKSRKGLTFGDMAVLCRASSSFNDFERAFDKAGIPFTTVSGQGFYDRPEIRDVLNALSVFENPRNDLALVGLMRSPAIGLPDPFLMDLRDYQRSQQMGSLLVGVREYADDEIDKWQTELRELIEIVDEFTALAGRITVAELIGRFLERTNYTAGLLLAGQDRAVENLKKLIMDAQISGTVNLTDFLSSIEEIRNVAIREGEAQIVVQGAVQIMSVHQAKGLEFPVVVLGDAAKRERFSRDILIDDHLGLIPPFSLEYLEEGPDGTPAIMSGKSSAYEIALERERLKEDAESRRLLYVAATRAQDLLLVSGAIGKPNRNGKLPNLGGWMGLLLDPLGIHDRDLILEAEGAEIHRSMIGSENLSARLVIYESGVTFDLSNEFARNRGQMDDNSLESVIWDKLDTGIEADGQRTIQLKPIYPASKMVRTSLIPARVVGDVVHKALELWKFPARRETDFIEWVEAEFRKAGVYPEEAVKLGYRRVRDILDRFSGTDLYQRMDRAKVILREVPFHLEEKDAVLVSGSIDALFKEESGWVLVEYKTDQIVTGAEIPWHDLDYVEQVEGYLDAAEQILGQRPEPVLCFLDYGGRVKLINERWG